MKKTSVKESPLKLRPYGAVQLRLLLLLLLATVTPMLSTTSANYSILAPYNEKPRYLVISRTP